MLLITLAGAGEAAVAVSAAGVVVMVADFVVPLAAAVGDVATDITYTVTRCSNGIRTYKTVILTDLQ